MSAAIDPERDAVRLRHRLRQWLIRPIDAEVGQSLLEALRSQAVRIPIPVTLMALVVVWLGKDEVPVPAQITWLIAVAALQGLRYVRLSALARETDRPAEDRLFEGVVLSAINGVVVGLSAGFYLYLDEIARCLHTMIMVGMVSGGVATSHGYRPLFFAFVGPVLAGVILGWLLVPAPGIALAVQIGVPMLTLLLGFIFNALARDSYHSFTEAFRINVEIRRALRAEQSANNAKTRFLAAASHDLRQPLQSLSMFSAALAKRELDPKSTEIAVNIREAVSDLTTELDALLDISKLDAGVVKLSPEPINLGLMVQRVVAATRSLAASKGLDLRVELLASSWIMSDRLLLERVLRNLLDNAIKYTAEGAITVTVARGADGQCEIAVADTGIGIAAHEQPRVFEEFYQLGNLGRDRRKGLGLGLSIVSRLVPLLGGRISVHSVPGSGSTFTVTLPCTETQARPPEPVVEVPPPRLDGIIVLLIEDDIGVRLGTRLLLEGLGCSVIEAGSTQQALDAIAHIEPDVTLTDLRLPDGDDGLNAVRKLRMRLPRLPVVLVSGETAPERLRDADRIGAPLLVKPVEESALVSAIVKVLGED
ncbi:MAG: hybrid sensor histidine kinase/response regulator [Burkholderiaceae bacterium]